MLIAERLLEQFPDLLMTVEAMIAEEYTLAIRLLSEETNLGALNGVIPPTGKRFALARGTGSKSPSKSWSSTG